MDNKDIIKEDSVSFFKVGKIRYLRSKKYKKGYCQICDKRRKTTAHHIIPKRLRCVCPHLAEIRIRVCSECEDGLHPENKFIKESVIVKRQSKNISNLKEAVLWRDKKIRSLMSGIEKIKNDIFILAGFKDEDFYISKKAKVVQKEVSSK